MTRRGICSAPACWPPQGDGHVHPWGDELFAALVTAGNASTESPTRAGVGEAVARRILGSAVFVTTLFGSALVGAEQPGVTAKENKVFSLEPVTVTAPWPHVPPQYKVISKPPYPEAARVREQEGTVLLLLKLGADGHVGDVRIQKASGKPLLDDAAAKAARDWTFIPARQGAKPVEAWVEVPVKFELKGAAWAVLQQDEAPAVLRYRGGSTAGRVSAAEAVASDHPAERGEDSLSARPIVLRGLGGAAIRSNVSGIPKFPRA